MVLDQLWHLVRHARLIVKGHCRESIEDKMTIRECVHSPVELRSLLTRITRKFGVEENASRIISLR